MSTLKFLRETTPGPGMQRFIALLITAGVVAGCLDGADSPNDLATADADEPLAERFDLVASADLEVGQVEALVTRVSFQGNCVDLPASALDRVVYGNATLQWTPLTTLQQELELRVAGHGGARVATGPSPLSVKLDDMKPDDYFEGLVLMAQATSPGVAVGQMATLAVDITYKGDEGLALGPAEGCAFS